MKAIQCTTPGTLDYIERSMPVMKQGQTILRIKRVGVCGTDLHAFDGTQPYFNYPRILGHELAAEIVETGAAGFNEGEAVTIMPYFYCGVCIACRNGKTNCCVDLRVCGVHVDGGMTEYLSVPSTSLVKSEGLNFDELAIVEPLAIGAHGIRRADIMEGEFVLVIGAGPIGLGLMEMGLLAGGKLIAMDINSDRLNFCSGVLGVEHIVNASAQDVIGQLKEITSGEMPSLVIDATGNLAAINEAFNYISHGGRYILVGLQKGDIKLSHPDFHKREATLMSSRNATYKDFEQVISYIKDGRLNPKKYITHRLQFDTVTDQFRNLLDPSGKVIKAMIEL